MSHVHVSMWLFITARRYACLRTGELGNPTSDDEMTLILSDQSTDCIVSSPAFKYRISVWQNGVVLSWLYNFWWWERENDVLMCNKLSWIKLLLGRNMATISSYCCDKVLFNPLHSTAPPASPTCSLSQTGSIITNTADRITGVPTPSISELNCKATTHIAQDIAHPLNLHFTKSPGAAEGLTLAKAWYLQP